MEIERKFLIKYIPDNLRKLSEHKIIQSYLIAEDDFEIRLRNIDDKYFITIKIAQSNIERIEKEIEISEELYSKLDKRTNKHLYKTRTKYKYDEYILEVDEYENGLKLLEIEFENVQQAKDFIVPEWIEKEVTYYKEFYNKNIIKNF